MKLKHYLVFLLVFLGTSALFAQSQSSYKNTQAIAKLIEKKRSYNKTHKEGFRIQLYNGLEKRAKSTRYRFQVEFPGTATYLAYDAPEWKIQVGHYKTRLDADRALNEIREKFDGAIVVPLQ